MDIYHKYIIDAAESMKYFAGDDKTFKYNRWKDWRDACIKAGKVLDTKEFKCDISKNII